MRFFNFSRCLVLFLVVSFLCLNSQVYAVQLPRHLEKEREDYLDRQVSTEAKIFLTRLARALRHQAELNQAARNFSVAFPSREEVERAAIKGFQKAGATAMKSAFGGDPGKGVVEFASNFFGKASPIIGLVYDMAMFIDTVQQIQAEMGEASLALQRYNSFTSRMRSFHDANNRMTVSMILEEAQRDFQETAGMLCHPAKIAELKYFFEMNAKYFDNKLRSFEWHFAPYIIRTSPHQRALKAKDAKIRDTIERLNQGLLVEGIEQIVKGTQDIIKGIEEFKDPSKKKDYVTKAAERLMSVNARQFKLNREFCRETLKKLNNIPTPEEPRLSGFRVASVKVIPPEGKKEKDLRIGDVVTVKAVIENPGDITAERSVARLKSCSSDRHGLYCYGDHGQRPGGINRSVPSIAPKGSYTAQWEYKIQYTKVNTLVVMPNYDSKAWGGSPSLTNKAKVSLKLREIPDLSVEFIKFPKRIYVNKEAKIGLRIKNSGNLGNSGFKVKLLANSSVVDEQGVGSIVERGKHLDVFLKWTPKSDGDYELSSRVIPGHKAKDLNDENNRAKQKVKVFLPQHAWEIEEGSLHISPGKPKIGDKVNIYFVLVNNGASENITATVYVDNKQIKRLLVKVAPKERKTIGMANLDKMTWKVRGGTHVIKVAIDKSKTSGLATATKTIGIATLMPGVQGIDLVLDKKNVSYKNAKVTVKIYNRGSQPAPNVLLHAIEYRSYSETPGPASFSRNIGTIESHELRTATMDMGLSNSKLVISVDKNNKIKERDEQNNRVEYIVGSYRPYAKSRSRRAEDADLTVAGIVNLDRPLETGETRPIEISIGNLNMADAKGVAVEYEIKNIDTKDRDISKGYLKGRKNLGAINAEGRKTFVINYKGVYPARYTLMVKVDPSNKVKETDEIHNNVMEKDFRVKGEVTSGMFFAGKDVDLSIDDEVTVSNSEPPAGLAVNFSVTIHNNTGIDVWGTDLDMFVDGQLVDGQALGTFSSETTRELSFSYVFNRTGDYKVKFMVDAKETVPEKNERNNTVTTTIKVKPGVFGTGHRDVAVASFSLSKTSCFQAEPVTARATIRNVGQDVLRGVLCTIGPSGRKPVYIKIVPILDPGQEIEISTTLPALFVGDHIIEARVDGKNVIKETNEENNIKTATLHVEPITAGKVKEEVKQKATNVIIKKIDQIQGAIDGWLRGGRSPSQ